MEPLLGFPLSGLTAPALLLVAVWLVLTGRIVPRRTYDDVINDRNEWRTAHNSSEQARQELAQQVEELLEHSRTTTQILQSLPSVGVD